MKYKINKTLTFLFSIFLFFSYGNFAKADNLGDMKDFSIDRNFRDTNESSIKATLRFIGDRAYYYIENKYFDSLSEDDVRLLFLSLEKLSNEYDFKIEPTLKEKLGSIRSPGIDGEDRVYVLILDLKDDFGGYFNTADSYKKEYVESKISNEKEIVYLNSDFIKNDDMKAFLAHEITHLITLNAKEINKKTSEDIWLNELRSEYSLDLLGYNNPYKNSILESRVEAFKSNPSDSLLEWQNKEKDYAVVSLFAQYLAGNYGDDFFKKTLDSDYVGIKSIEDALLNMGRDIDFSDIFSDWQIANYINNIYDFGSEYGYKNKNLNFKVSPTVDYFVSGDKVSFQYKIKDWQQAWLKYKIDSNYVKFIFESDDSDNFSLSYIAFRENNDLFFSEIPLDDGYGEISFDNLDGNIDSIVLLPHSESKISDFSSDEPKKSFNIDIILEKTNQSDNLKKQNNLNLKIKDGDLIRPAWSYDVYKVKGEYIYHIKTPEILKLYNKSVFVVGRDIFDRYKKSYLFRVNGDYKVYEWKDGGVIEWLNMSPEEFVKSGREFESVFEINSKEFFFYKK